MADNTTSDSSHKNEPVKVDVNEDAETRAARRELKQSSISDPAPSAVKDKAAHPATPPAEVSDASKEQILSPKKKRAHDQLDEEQATDENDAKSTTSTDSARDRASRLEPEKKRHRDGQPSGKQTGSTSNDKTTADPSTDDRKSPEQQPQTSASAFAASGFGKLATGTSPFASLNASKGSGFASAGAPSLSSFASPQPKPAVAPAAPKLTFGGGNSASPFAGLSSGTNGFGSGFGGGGFAAAASGAKPLGSFAAPGAKPFQSEKPAKPFGAPDSDVESNDDENEEEEESQHEEERAVSPEKEPDDKKKPKLHKVEVNDGEAGEATIVSVRAKVFHHDKEAGWKERGAGMLKINVPEACVDFDDSGIPVPGSFDASGLELDDEETGNTGKGHKVARLILRQDQTHRVILNTAILPGMKFQEKTSLKSVGILFTAFEGEDAKPVNIHVKMSAANATNFMNEVGMVQRELRGS